MAKRLLFYKFCFLGRHASRDTHHVSQSTRVFTWFNEFLQSNYSVNSARRKTNRGPSLSHYLQGFCTSQVVGLGISGCHQQQWNFWAASGVIILPSRCLTVRPWNVIIPKGKDPLPTIIFQGRTVKLKGCTNPNNALLSLIDPWTTHPKKSWILFIDSEKKLRIFWILNLTDALKKHCIMATLTWRIIPVSKWLVTMVIVSPLNGVMGPLINGLFMAYKWWWS